MRESYIGGFVMRRNNLLYQSMPPLLVTTKEERLGEGWGEGILSTIKKFDEEIHETLWIMEEISIFPELLPSSLES